jgi:type III secretion protein S
MTPSNILDFTREGLTIVLWVCFPIVAVAIITSLVVAVIQAVTQVQDQSIGQSVRLGTVMLAVLILAGTLGGDVLHFAERAFQTLMQFA